MKNFTLIGKKYLLIFCSFVLLSLSATAQTRAIYFIGYNSSTATFPKAATGFNSTVVSSGSINYSGLNTVNDNRTVWDNPNSSSSLNTSTAPYLSYTVNMNGTKSLLLDRFVMCGLATFASVKLQLRWSIDNYAASLGEFTINGSNYTLSSINLSSQGTVTASTITFRVYFYNAATWIFNSDTGPYSSLDGTPSSYGAFGQNVALWYSNMITLPLTWKSFTAKSQQDQTALLNWETLNESNNSSFAIEHSTDGQNYSVINTIAAAASTNSVNKYEIIHTSPVNGKNYYRIKQIDIDGKFSYSPIKVITIGGKGIIKSYPNPITDQLTVYLGETLITKGNLTINSLNGQQVFWQKIQGESNTIVIPATSWTNGIYILKITGEDGSLIHEEKIVKK